jgi:hypothetical protein
LGFTIFSTGCTFTEELSAAATSTPCSRASELHLRYSAAEYRSRTSNIHAIHLIPPTTTCQAPRRHEDQLESAQGHTRAVTTAATNFATRARVVSCGGHRICLARAQRPRLKAPGSTQSCAAAQQRECRSSQWHGVCEELQSVLGSLDARIYDLELPAPRSSGSSVGTIIPAPLLGGGLQSPAPTSSGPLARALAPSSAPPPGAWGNPQPRRGWCVAWIATGCASYCHIQKECTSRKGAGFSFFR